MTESPTSASGQRLPEESRGSAPAAEPPADTARDKHQSNPRFWLLWLGGGLCFLAVFPLALLIMAAVDRSGTPLTDSMIYLALVVSLLAAVTGAGVLQSCAISRSLANSGWWIPASLIGWVIAVPVWLLVALQMPVPTPYLAIALWTFVSGMILGLPQWLFLRKRVARSAIWLLAAAFAWLGAMAFVAWIAAYFLPTDPAQNWIVGSALFGGYGLILAVVTGLVMKWILTRVHATTLPSAIPL